MEGVERSTGTLTRGTFVIKYLAWLIRRLQAIEYLVEAQLGVNVRVSRNYVVQGRTLKYRVTRR